MIKLPQMNFFLEKQLIKFSCTYWPLSFCKIFKKFLGPIQSYEDVSFSGPKWSNCHEQFFLVQTIIITFIYLLALFTVQNLKKILTANPELWGCVIFGPKIVHSPRGAMLRQVFLKVQSWAHYSFLSLSMTYQKVSNQTLNCSLTTHHYFPWSMIVAQRGMS